ncbi:hypothetical protein PRIPAC_96838 [Pristionchus pacificus]|uniref:Uncharacterized protein n=1 Tax=Pristionchus pacificus TaxID=54126 RepID=A0A2A6D0H5_PRIPA|nr:hypothetical protein PRIPAC_96838 [Pristionchus pacificus]|eukprot:PDM83982.1 hypothetical protein PRIPAC_34174 [Pristionchus pacificus]
MSLDTKKRWAEQIEWKDEDYEPINREGRVHGPYATTLTCAHCLTHLRISDGALLLDHCKDGNGVGKILIGVGGRKRRLRVARETKGSEE